MEPRVDEPLGGLDAAREPLSEASLRAQSHDGLGGRLAVPLLEGRLERLQLVLFHRSLRRSWPVMIPADRSVPVQQGCPIGGILVAGTSEIEMQELIARFG